jgi:predicted nucleotidyltransferase
MPILPGVVWPEAEIASICRRYGVKELSVFGSAARGEMRPESDIDLLVDFLPDARPSLLDLSAMMREFSALLGRRVDIAVKRSFSATRRYATPWLIGSPLWARRLAGSALQ